MSGVSQKESLDTYFLMGLCFMKPKNTIAPLKLDFAAEKKGGKAVSTV